MSNMQQNPQKPQTLADRTVLARLKVGRLTQARRDKNIEELVALDTGVAGKVTASKRLFSESNRACGLRDCYQDIRNYHTAHTLVWFDEGPRLLPNAQIMQYKQNIDSLSQQYEALARDFAAHLDEEIDSDRRVLTRTKKVFNEADYPSPQEVIDRCYVDLLLIPLPSSADFRTAVDTEVKKQLDEQLARATELANKDAIGRVLGPLTKMLEKLKSAPDDKPLKIYKSMTSNITEAAEVVLNMGYIDDPNVERFIKAAAAVATAVEKHGASLRVDYDKRQALATKVDEVLGNFGGIL